MLLEIESIFKNLEIRSFNELIIAINGFLLFQCLNHPNLIELNDLSADFLR